MGHDDEDMLRSSINNKSDLDFGEEGQQRDRALSVEDFKELA